MSTELTVPDATCGHCKQTIESSVAKIDGVRSADLDLETKKLTVEHDEGLDRDVLVGAVTAAGYSPES